MPGQGHFDGEFNFQPGVKNGPQVLVAGAVSGS